MSKGARLRSHRQQLQDHVRQGKPGQTWYRIENLMQSPGTACIYVYGEIGMWGIEANDFIRDLNQITANQIDLHINSMGGEVFEGIAILNALRAHRASITTYVDGIAASIASVIAMAGNRIVMGRQTTMMVHEPHIIAIGGPAEIRSTLDMMEKKADDIAAVYAEKAGGTVESWRQIMQAETWYSADEAVATGLADEVDTTGLPDEASADAAREMAASYDLSVFRYPGRDAAPAPRVPDNSVPEVSADEPEAEPGGAEAPPEPDPAPPAGSEQPRDPEPEPESEVVEPEPAAEPAQDQPSPVDEWASLFDGLTQTTTFADDVFAALLK